MTKPSLLLCCLMILAAVIATAFYMPSLPASIPTHWNLAGHIDGYGGRGTLWLMPAMMLGVLAMGALVPKMAGQKAAIASFAPTYSLIIVVPLGVLGAVEALMLDSGLHGGRDFPQSLPGLIFVMLILMGNLMGKVKQNRYMGIRTPWTLASERVWYATHRLAAKLMVASGLLGLLAVAVNAPRWLIMLLLLGWPLIAVLYSWRVSRHE